MLFSRDFLRSKIATDGYLQGNLEEKHKFFQYGVMQFKI